jgi:hypothetical protein
MTKIVPPVPLSMDTHRQVEELKDHHMEDSASKLMASPTIVKGTVDMKEFAPHLLEQVTNSLKRSQSIGGFATQPSKDFEFVKIIQHLY